MRNWAFFILLLFIPAGLNAKDKKTLKVFLDCSKGGDCYSTYVREKLPAIDYVRDRLDADVHVINMSNYTSAGLEQRILFFIGRDDFQNINDTLKFSYPDNLQLQDKRDLFVKNLSLGLLPYILETDVRSSLTITMETPDSTQILKDESDPWRLWVNEIGFSGSLQQSRNYSTKSGNGYFNISKENEKIKSSLYLSANIQNQKYRVDDSTTLSYDFKSSNLNINHLVKLNEHWGVGVWASYRNSLYSNYIYRIALGPKIEYSILPYSDFNTKRVVLIYDINPVINKYYDTTIYFKTNEVLFNHSLSLISQFNYDWGSLNLGVFYNNYLHNWTQNYLGINGAISLKIIKGLNFGVYGNYDLQNNQINLRKGDVDIDQLLVQNRELFTSYNFYMRAGLSYRFGSTKNNVVNPIFRGLSYSKYRVDYII